MLIDEKNFKKSKYIQLELLTKKALKIVNKNKKKPVVIVCNDYINAYISTF